MNTSGACGFHLGALAARPVFIVADRHEYFVILYEISAAVRVYTGRVGDIVPVCLKPSHHGVLCVENKIFGRRAARGDRTVVAHLIRATCGRSDIQAIAAILVVRLPCRVRRLEQNVRMARVVANNEDDMAGS